jgi:hypothetical protein
MNKINSWFLELRGLYIFQLTIFFEHVATVTASNSLLEIRTDVITIAARMPRCRHRDDRRLQHAQAVAPVRPRNLASLAGPPPLLHDYSGWSTSKVEAACLSRPARVCLFWLRTSSRAEETRKLDMLNRKTGQNGMGAASMRSRAVAGCWLLHSPNYDHDFLQCRISEFSTHKAC